MKYVNLVIDNKNDNTDTFYTYGCEFDNIKVGDKVYVPFNRGNKIKEAYVFQVMDEIEEKFANLKYVESIDGEISLGDEIIDVCRWMKRRYFCRYIDAVKLFLPAGSKAKRRIEKEPLKDFQGEIQDIEHLTKEQEEVVASINHAIKKSVHGRFLLQGVTGSGKTEVYMQCAAKTLEMGKNVIILVPEVSLTKQIVDRFITRFGMDKLAIMHSKLSLGERYDQWQKIRNGHSKIIIGARSAIFAPVENIGLVVIDEEHEATYKSDMTPKYDTVEVAIKRTAYSGGCLVLGSATPSITSLYRAEHGIYKKLELKNRYNNMPLPKVSIVDMRDELKSGNRSVFSKELYDKVKATLEAKQQVILLINKRGYSTFVSCRNCGYVAKCDKCNISMTYHKSSDKLECHYCGRREEVPTVCPECGSKYIRHFGAGTEKIAEEAEKMFPNSKVAKMDFDTTKKKGEINRILGDFAKGKIDILVGTQIVGKGMDYKNVGLVGIVAIDGMLNIPDYRSVERTFQLIAQAAGRTGRGEEEGKVVVQTYSPDDFAVVSGANQDVEKFYRREILKRELTGYPPFTTIAQIDVVGKEHRDVKSTMSLWKKAVKQYMGDDVIIGENVNVKGKECRYALLIKYDNFKNNTFRGMAEGMKEKLRTEKNKCSSIIDINPYNTWRN